jgi:uncharacterized membrane protein YoaK (UPF0700 family)
MAKLIVPALLAFNGGFVDTAGFLGLQGLFTTHVTGNFVTLAATLVMGTHGIIAKLLVLPEFVIVVAFARAAGSVMRARGLPALPILLTVKVCFLLAFLILAVAFGPFPDSDAPPALFAGFAGVAAMAVQNGVQRVHFASMPPTTIMTGNTTQAVLDAVDLISGPERDDVPAVRARFGRVLRGIVWFATGCATAAVLYYWVGFWCLIVPVAAGAATAMLHHED